MPPSLLNVPSKHSLPHLLEWSVARSNEDGITHEAPTGYENTTKGVSRQNKVTLREEDSGWIIIEQKTYEISIPKMDKSKFDVDAFHTLFSRSEDRKKLTCPKITGTLRAGIQHVLAWGV